uniref:Uncharacterized protein n=1 Tax=Anguilla anguilla TaxID=7936 RepID=A0A0E9R750_ANGAN
MGLDKPRHLTCIQFIFSFFLFLLSKRLKIHAPSSV